MDYDIQAEQGLDTALEARAIAEALGADTATDIAVDAALKAAGIISVLFTGVEGGYRLNGGEVQATAEIAGVDAGSVGPGLIYQLVGRGSPGGPSEQVRGPRIKGGPLDVPGMFHAERYDTNYKAWDSTTGYDHPNLAFTVPCEPYVSSQIVALTICEIYPASTNTRVSGSVVIGENGIDTGSPAWDNSASNGRRTYVHRAQQWYTLIAIHNRLYTPQPETPTPGGEPITVRTRLFREGQAGNNRLGNAQLWAFRLPR